MDKMERRFRDRAEQNAFAQREADKQKLLAKVNPIDPKLTEAIGANADAIAQLVQEFSKAFSAFGAAYNEWLKTLEIRKRQYKEEYEDEYQEMFDTLDTMTDLDAEAEWYV